MGEDPDFEAIMNNQMFKPQSQTPLKEEQKEEDLGEDLENSATKHRMARDDIEMSTDEDGTKVINGFLRIKEKIGKGAFCDVRKAIGIYEAEPPEFPDEERIPYALKVYSKQSLRKPVT